ncbi:M48 family metallopeptidase [Undibacterium terreum]|uniref:Peptidase M48 domain-containing protein n=1 Tax=Undibacterium terreum TaxID=1224302 RepID=A0A916UCQ0_9BURK|nr:M48 family metallopeptidase [Undibacterium terreum]GGC66217.1 hypothetical protein GCM10011396_11560 [Undibacterium terreum]
MISAYYFDGHCGRQHLVTLSVAGGNILLSGPDVTKTESVAQARLEEPFQHAPGILHFADGSHCELASAEDQQFLMRAMKYLPGRVARWQGRWPVALLAVAAMVAGLGAAYYWGIPAAATRLAEYAPVELEQKMGAQMLAGLDTKVFLPTQLGPLQQSQARAIFRQVLPISPRLPLKLEFRNSAVFGPNAIALPGGTIVVTDSMIAMITGVQINKNMRERSLTGLAGAQLAGVMAHEIGHEEHRHSMRQLASNGLAAAITGSLFGDFSALATAAPALLIQSEYSRELESEADDYAIKTLTQRGISIGPMADLFAQLDANRPADDNETPKWMRNVSNYLASHPQTTQRIAMLRAHEKSEAAIVPAETMPTLQYKLGLDTLAELDKAYCNPTHLSEQRVAQVQDIFNAVAPLSAAIPLRLYVRNSRRLGPNVVALPGGIIVVTDQMLDSIVRPHGDRSGKTLELKGAQAEQLAGLLAREIGHIQKGHLNRSLQVSGLKGDVAGDPLNDIGTMARSEALNLLYLHYTNSMQAEADDYAASLLKERAIPAAPMLTLLSGMRADPATMSGNSAVNGKRNMGYLDMHPSTEYVLARFRL